MQEAFTQTDASIDVSNEICMAEQFPDWNPARGQWRLDDAFAFL